MRCGSMPAARMLAISWPDLKIEFLLNACTCPPPPASHSVNLLPIWTTRAEIGIGRNCHIECAILDKNVRIGDNVVIKPFPRDRDIDGDLYFVRDGIVVIAKNTEIPSGMKIAPAT